MNDSAVDVHLSGDLSRPTILRDQMQTLHALCSDPDITCIRVDLSRVGAATGRLYSCLHEIDMRLRERGARLHLVGSSTAAARALEDRRLGLGELGAVYFASRPVVM